MARKWTAVGGSVALVARTAKTLEEVARELGPSRAAAFPLDVADLGALAALPARVKERFGRLDVVVNNAGVNHRGPIAKHTVRELEQVIVVNLVAPITLTRAAMDLVERGGAIVNVASVAGLVPVPGEAAYSASKAGLRAFARAIEDEMAARGIHVGNVCPGPVDTGFFGDLDEVPDLVFSQRMSTAEQIADAVMTCIRTRRPEITVPPEAAALATIAYVFPTVAKRLRPALERRGAQKKKAYAARVR